MQTFVGFSICQAYRIIRAEIEHLRRTIRIELYACKSLKSIYSAQISKFIRFLLELAANGKWKYLHWTTRYVWMRRNNLNFWNNWINIVPHMTGLINKRYGSKYAVENVCVCAHTYTCVQGSCDVTSHNILMHYVVQEMATLWFDSK